MGRKMCEMKEAGAKLREELRNERNNCEMKEIRAK